MNRTIASQRQRPQSMLRSAGVDPKIFPAKPKFEKKLPTISEADEHGGQSGKVHAGKLHEDRCRRSRNRLKLRIHVERQVPFLKNEAAICFQSQATVTPFRQYQHKYIGFQKYFIAGFEALCCVNGSVAVPNRVICCIASCVGLVAESSVK